MDNTIYKEMVNEASEEDIKKIAEDITKMKKGPIAEVWDKVMLLWKLVKDPNAAWTQKAIAIGALVYLVSPVDAIPDTIPVIGLLDDAAVISMAVYQLSTALKKYTIKENRLS